MVPVSVFQSLIMYFILCLTPKFLSSFIILFWMKTDQIMSRLEVYNSDAHLVLLCWILSLFCSKLISSTLSQDWLQHRIWRSHLKAFVFLNWSNDNGWILQEQIKTETCMTRECISFQILSSNTWHCYPFQVNGKTRWLSKKIKEAQAHVGSSHM